MSERRAEPVEAAAPLTDEERGAARSTTVRREGGAPVDLRSTLIVARRGRGDPTWADGPGDVVWKAWRTPAGPVTVRLVEEPDGATVSAPDVGMGVGADVIHGVAHEGAAGASDRTAPNPPPPDADHAEALHAAGVNERSGARSPRQVGGPRVRSGRLRPTRVAALAWGPGAGWVIERLPSMLGGEDDPSGFVPRHERVAAALAAHPGWRVPRTGLVVEALVPSILEQRVTGVEALASYRRLVRAYGSPAPGPGAVRGLSVAPSARDWSLVPSWAWLKAGVDASRSATVMRAMRVAGRLDEAADLDLDAARARLLAVPGIGVWTLAEVAHVALGDADAVSFGDYHVAKDIGWALTGEEVDDAGLADILAPDAPHRYRVQRLLELAGARRPRHGPRRTLPTHLPW